MTQDEIAQVQGQIKPGPKPRRSALVETGVMLDARERTALDAVAEQQGRSRSDLIREAVRKVWLKKRNGKEPT